MSPIQPDLEWCSAVSAHRSLAPRCPFASVHRCPRYFQSRSLLGTSGIATSIDAAEDKRLMGKWQRSDLWPVVDEQRSQVISLDKKPSHFRNFCPEVSFDTFGWFASELAFHADEVDVGAAHRRLAQKGATTSDWRWTWAVLNPMHYSECPVYSPLMVGEKNQLRARQSIVQRYQKLSLWSKISFWGSLASIIGVFTWLLTPETNAPDTSQANAVTASPGSTVFQSARDIVVNPPATPTPTAEQSSPPVKVHPSAPRQDQANRKVDPPSLAHIEQRSEGPNSPNIIGQGNQVIYNSRQEPWQLDDLQIARIQEQLGGTSVKVKLWALMNEPNASSFSASLGATLAEIGWDAEWGNLEARTPYNGIIVVVGNSDFPEAARLQETLRSFGIEAAGSVQRGMPAGTMEIRVGGKPEE